MAFKTVLCVTEVDHSNQDVRIAASLCAEVAARLSVLVIKFALRRPIDAVSTGWLECKQDMLGLQRRSAETLSHDLARLEHRCREIHTLLEGMWVPCDIDTDYSDRACVGDVVRQRALCADLTVIGPSLLNDDDLGPLAIDGSLFESGKPVLLVPNGVKASLRPRRILVGWDSRVETSRVVRQALHLLSGAAHVRVTLIDPEATGNGPESEIDIAAFLAQQGIRVVVDRLPTPVQPVTTALARHAIDTSADMVVLGACGHRRLRERIFGGVTRWITGEPPLPLLVAR
ncbi:universal stress protein [Mesorhizobium sp. WSM3224]|uniref:universal stress protein n=1 Tax=Mesorhizobium sp. WSM3224 TaxID=1040986 RepID=UPI00048296DE|nr:universal stress protein [Mesorhizobium sp. WSM3224]